MEDSLIAALKSMLTIQRWNLQPKVETWVEAENAMLVAHLAYGIAKGKRIPDRQITHLLFRILLKSLNKHYTTDISHFVTNELKNNKKYLPIWENIVNKYADKVAMFLPREISAFLKTYLVYKGDYGIQPKDNKRKSAGPRQKLQYIYISKKQRSCFEDIILFCQYRAAIQEYEINATIYREYYKEIKKESKAIDKVKIKHYREYHAIAKRCEKYFQTIARLKYIRRWNTINRFISSSVLGHTYVVAVLTLVLSLYENKSEAFVREALLRAMFHDVPESMTGDIITPVKEELKRFNGDLVSEIGAKLTQEKFTNKVPISIKKVLGPPYLLLEEPSNEKIKSTNSLVKDCDRLALMVECLCEKEAKVEIPEMEEAYHKCYRELSNSEWSKVREFLGILADRWLKP